MAIDILLNEVMGWLKWMINWAMSSMLNLSFMLTFFIGIGLATFFVVRRKENPKKIDTAANVVALEVEKVQERKPAEPEVVDQYMVDGLLKVKILRMNNSIKYVVEEPELDERLSNVVQEVEETYIKKGVEPSDILKKLRLDDEELKIVTYHVMKDLKGCWKLEPLIRDEQLEDITVTKPGPAYVISRKYPDFSWIETNITFTAEELDRQARILAERHGAELSIAKPSAEVMTHEGDRIAITYAGELTPGTSTLTIRKFPRSPYTVLDLIRFGTVDYIIAAYIWTMLEEKKFVLIAGPTGSGKTTFLSTILQLLPSNVKILTLEDYHPEINLSWHRNWHRFVTRRTLGETAYSLADVLRLSLRHRPEYTVVGEVRGLEASVMFAAASTGHGMSSTIHAENLEDVYERLTSVSMGVGKDELSFLDVVVLIKNTSRGRKVINVWEIERVGKEHLVAWYDSRLDKFFPENWRQLASNSPTIVNDPIMKTKYELRVMALKKLIDSNVRLTAEELSKVLDEQRRVWKEIVVG